MDLAVFPELLDCQPVRSVAWNLPHVRVFSKDRSHLGSLQWKDSFNDILLVLVILDTWSSLVFSTVPWAGLPLPVLLKFLVWWVLQQHLHLQYFCLHLAFLGWICVEGNDVLLVRFIGRFIQHSFCVLFTNDVVRHECH